MAHNEENVFGEFKLHRLYRSQMLHRETLIFLGFIVDFSMKMALLMKIIIFGERNMSYNII